MTEPRIWIVDDDRSMRWVMEQSLATLGEVTSFIDAESALKALRDAAPDVLVSDIRMPGKSGLDLLAELQATNHRFPVIIITAFGDLETTVNAYAKGAYEHLSKPFDIDELNATVERAIRERGPQRSAARREQHGFVGESPAMQDVFRAIGRLARTRMNVMIRGETGVGKELVARALHEHSARANGPFIAINTAAIPETLLESELFGHEKGAFTGAGERQSGRFEQAAGGTLFLDEIGDMPAALQTRLLRVLAEGEFYRVGGRQLVRSDARVIAATHRDLRSEVRHGRFREDLLHRLDVVAVEVPPLRERHEDIEPLTTLFFAKAATETGLPARHFSPDALECLHLWSWPGNVRELRNLCYNLTVMAPGREIAADDLPAEMRQSASRATGPAWSAGLGRWASDRLENESGGGSIMADTLEIVEKALVLAALKATNGRKAEAARRLGMGRNTLTRKLKEYGLEP